MYSVLSHRVSEFAFDVFQLVCPGIDNMNRVVVVSAFYETKRTADEQVSFAKNDQQSVNRYLARAAIKSQ